MVFPGSTLHPLLGFNFGLACDRPTSSFSQNVFVARPKIVSPRLMGLQVQVSLIYTSFIYPHHPIILVSKNVAVILRTSDEILKRIRSPPSHKQVGSPCLCRLWYHMVSVHQKLLGSHSLVETIIYRNISFMKRRISLTDS